MLTTFHRRSSIAGFSLIEVLVVIVMIGILSAISIPSWLNFMKRQRVNAAQGQAFQAMRVAQANARKEKRPWQVSFQDPDPPGGTNYPLQLAVHRSGTTPTWQPLPDGDADQVEVYSTKTTLKQNLPICGSGVLYCVRFEPNGQFSPKWIEQQTGSTAPSATTELGKITFQPLGESSPSVERFQKCVVASTILGSIRTAEGTDCN